MSEQLLGLRSRRELSALLGPTDWANIGFCHGNATWFRGLRRTGNLRRAAVVTPPAARSLWREIGRLTRPWA